MLPTATEIGGLIDDGDDFWGIAAGGRVLQRIDTKSRSLGQQISLGVSPYWFAPSVAFGAIWASDPHEPALLKIDPRYGRISDTIKLRAPGDPGAPQNAQGVAVTKDAVWIVYGYPKRIARYDPGTGTVVTNRVGNGAFYDGLVAADGDDVWVVDRSGRNLFRVDPRDGEVVAEGHLHDGWVEDARVVDGSLWVAMRSDGGVWQVSRNGETVGKVATGDVPFALAGESGALWVANANSGTVTRVDTTTSETRTFQTGHRPLALGVRGNQLWVYLGLGAADARARISGSNVIREAAVGDPYYRTDPAVLAGAGSLVVNYATGARLTDYRPRPTGAAEIVPDAAAPARVTDGGRTWTFRIRDGFRFSPPSGEPVTAETFRYSIERALSPKLENTYCREANLPDIAGEDAYAAGKAPHISGLSVSGKELRIQLVAPSWTLPARLAMPCFSAVPIGTPVAPDGLEEPIPSAGPYYIDSHIVDFQLVLKKNPNYGGTRRQPSDGVIVTSVASPAEAGQLVEQGKADYAFDDGNPPSTAFAPGGRYDRAYGNGSNARYVRKPANGTRFLFFNTLAGPFADVKLRRAAALALDRAALAESVGGAPRGLFVPPGIPGYNAQEPYRSAPELARARALVGNRRVDVLLVTDASNPRGPPLAEEIRRDLERVGIDVRIHYDTDAWGYAVHAKPRADVLLDGWSADFPDASNFFTAILDPRDGLLLYPPWFQDERWLGRIRAAARLRGAARATAYRRLDLDLARGPLPVTGLAVNRSAPQLFSARVRCRTYLPMFNSYVDPSSLCVQE